MAEGGAILSPDREYRYRLWRHATDYPSRRMNVIGLNPSTADETTDDPTIRRCLGFAAATGHGTLVMTNLFAYRSFDPATLAKVIGLGGDAIGPDNDAHLAMVASECDTVVCAWGTHGKLNGRDDEVIELLLAVKPKLWCWGSTKAGYPRHPLYLAADTPLQVYGFRLPVLAAPTTELKSSKNPKTSSLLDLT